MWCMRDYHKRCLRDYADMVYTCANCCKMLTKYVEHLSQVNKNRMEGIRATQARWESMATPNSELSSRVADLSLQLASQTWQGFSHASNINGAKTCVIGSLIISDINRDRLINTDIINISRGTKPMIHESVNSRPDTYCRIVLMAGGNDCDTRNDSTRPVSNILEDYRLLIQDAKTKANEVTCKCSNRCMCIPNSAQDPNVQYEQPPQGQCMEARGPRPRSRAFHRKIMAPAVKAMVGDDLASP